MNGWVDDLYSRAVNEERSVLVSVIAASGSSPRGSGAKMIVTANDCLGSIGGGQLEYQCTASAREMLEQNGAAYFRRFVLGTPMDQCCGGAVEVLFEPITNGVPDWLEILHTMDLQQRSAVLVTVLDETPRKFLIHSTDQLSAPGLPAETQATAMEMLAQAGCVCRTDDAFLENIRATDFNIAVFGAGHVGSAVVAILARLNADILWIDDREGIFTDVPPGVRTLNSMAPAREVASMPPGSFYLVMTHSHEIDLGICLAILARDDVAYCGLIGSAPKRRRFVKRFHEHGLTQAQVDELVCPIGIDGIKGKLPAEIAIATAAEILQVYEQRTGDEDSTS